MKTKIEESVVNFDNNDNAVKTGYGFSKAISTQDELAIEFAKANKLDTVTKNQDGKNLVHINNVKIMLLNLCLIVVTMQK